jgi:citrate lyase gamma subunit
MAFRLAEKLVECAIIDKQSRAFQQIADHLEGKPVQMVDATVDDRGTLDQFSDAELTAILRRRVGVALGEK